MPLKSYKPTSPGQRDLVLVDKSDLWNGRPEKSLSFGLSKKGGIDVLDILLKTEYGDVYFFEYKNNVMFSYSNNDDFNDLLIEMKAKKRRAEEKKGQPPYRFVYCDEERMEEFEKEMRKRD